MRKFKFSLKLTLVLALFSLALAPVVLAQTNPQNNPNEPFFPQTGHSVRAPFNQFFLSTGGATRYGYPITESYVDTNTGLLVQYFQKTRLEWWPGNPDPYKIQLGLLGDELGKRQPGIPVSAIPSPNDPSCRYFSETGHSVCYVFLDYFKATGDIFQYGYPITEMMLENGRMVQYFQRARMEWWPEKPQTESIQLANVGEFYYTFAKLDPSRLAPPPNSAGPGQPTSLSINASVTKAIIAQNTPQVVYVSVRDQLSKRIAGAAVTMVMEFPDKSVAHTLPPTDVNGTTTFTFSSGDNTPGTTVQLRFVVDYAGLNTETRTSYLLWFY